MNRQVDSCFDQRCQPQMIILAAIVSGSIPVPVFQD